MEDFNPKFAKRKQYFLNEKTRDGRQWPMAQDAAEIGYQNWLVDITDPTTQEPYKSLDGRTAHYRIHQIVRIKLIDGSEKLYSIGTLVGFDQFKDERTHGCHSPEVHERLIFRHTTEQDPRTKKLIRVTTGIGGKEDIYELEFNAANVDKLFAKRASEYVQFVVKQQQNGEAHSCNIGTLAQSHKLFKDKPFEYLYNADYLTTEQKEELRKQSEALIQGQQTQGKK